MSTQSQQRTIEIPTQGAPTDWHLFRVGARKPAAGDPALCGHVLSGHVGHLDTSAGGSDNGVPWCALCAHLAAMLKDLYR